MKLMLPFFRLKSEKLYYTVKCSILFLLTSFVIPVVASSTELPSLNQPCFIENKGQFSPQVLFVAFTPTADIWITKTSVVQDFHSNTNPPISMEICGAKSLTGKPSDVLSGQMNYFHGDAQAVGVKRYGSVILKNVSSGIDMRWYFDNGQPRYDFIVKPGINPKNAYIDFKDVKNLTVNSKGELCFDTKDNTKERHQGLLAYQATDNGKVIVPCTFDIHRNKTGIQTVGFNVGKYDTSIPLIIDPVIMGSFFGGSGMDMINDIKLDEAGNIYVAGSTSTPGDLPSISSHYRLNNESSPGNSDGFFAKFTADGKTLVYYNIIGGNLTDEITSLVLDKSNSVYIGGNTNSSRFINGFPITTLAPDSVLGAQGEGSGFVAKFSNEGSSLEFCSYVGGEKLETISKIAYDEVNEAIYAVGVTFDNVKLPFNFNTYIGDGDAYYQAISIPLKRILFSGYLGGSGSDVATSLAIFKSSVVIVGYTKSEDVYLSSNASRGGTDGFIAKIEKSGGQILSFRYFGSTGDDRITGVTVDSVGRTIVCGTTNSPDLPIAGMPLLGSKIGESDGFVAQFSNSDSLMFSTFVGSTYDDEMFDVKVDNYGQIYAIGQTKGEITTPAIPKDADYVRRFGGLGTNDCFWVMVNPKDISLNYATYLGGSNADHARGIAIYKDHIYCAGYTLSNDFQPIGGTGFTPNHKGGSDGFFCSQDLPIHSPSISPASIEFGKVYINTIVKRDSIVIKNITSRPIRFTKTSQDYIPFALRHPLDSFTLNPLEKTVVYAYFAPETKGIFGSLFDIRYETGPPFEVKVSGEGIAPSISMTPKELDFGQLELDSTKTRKLLIANKGTAPGGIHFNKFKDNSLFKYKDDLVPKDTLLNIGESIEVSIVFTASLEGNFTEDFIVKSEETELYCKLTAEGIAPHFAWEFGNLYFGGVRLGHNLTMPVSLKNTGKARGKINSFRLQHNQEYALYVLDLPEDSTIHPGDLVQCTITFTPSLRTSATDSLYTKTQAGELLLPLYGNGIYPSMVQQSKEVLKYDNISVGASNFQLIKLLNIGNDVDTLYNIHLASISGEINFELVSKLAPGSLLSPESPFEFTAIFNPKSPGIKTDTAFITCGTKTFKTVLIGEGVTSNFAFKELKDTAISCGGTLVGSKSQTKTYIINNGSDTGYVGQIIISPSVKKIFSIDPSTKQNIRLGPNESSLVTINFSPDSIGANPEAFLQIYDSSEVMLTAKLRGEAIGALFTTDKTVVEFDSTYVDSKSDSLCFIIKNEGNIQKAPEIKVIKDDEKSFVQLTTSKVIGHNDIIKVFYQFTPHSPGKKYATILIGGSTAKAPYTIQLYGYARSSITKAELSFGDTISAKIGQKISLPLIVSNIDGKNLESVHSIRCVLRYNSTVLGVDYQLRDSLVVNNDMAILSLQRTTSKIKKGDTVLTLEFTVGLGNSPVTDVTVEKFEWKNEQDALIEISTLLPHSKVRVTDIAEINGNLRLYDSGHSAEMTLSANTLSKTPLSIHIDGGLHCSSLIVYDERGRVVRDLSSVLKSDILEFDFDTSTLSMGMYYCVLRDGNSMIVKDFVVR